MIIYVKICKEIPFLERIEKTLTSCPSQTMSFDVIAHMSRVGFSIIGPFTLGAMHAPSRHTCQAAMFPPAYVPPYRLDSKFRLSPSWLSGSTSLEPRCLTVSTNRTIYQCSPPSSTPPSRSKSSLESPPRIIITQPLVFTNASKPIIPLASISPSVLRSQHRPERSHNHNIHA